MTRRKALFILVFSGLLAITTSCSSAPTLSVPGLSPVAITSDDAWLARAGCVALQPATADPAAPNATPAGPTVLTVTGRLDLNSADPEPRTLDMAALDAMPQVECSVDDRLAEGRQVTFRGVLLATLLSQVGAQLTSAVRTAALNDYAVDLPSTDINTLPVLLATRADGAPMSVSHYGPLRIIYPTTGYDLDPTVYDPRRIWQLNTIDVS